MARKVLTLPEYIDQLGDEQFAQKYGVKLRTVRAYRLKERRPRPESLLTRRLLRESSVPWEGIYGS